MVAEVGVVTVEVVITKFALVEPATTVTLGGTAALELFEYRFTTAPPAGAAANSVTVPVEGVPPTTELGETLTLASPAPGVTVSVVVTEVAPSVAVIVAEVEVETESVEI